MDKKLTLIILVVLIIVIGWFYFALTSNEEVALPAENISSDIDMLIDGKNLDEFQHVVVYSESGFSPESLEVNIGDTVTFVNLAPEQMWVASAFHPTHLLYSEFDAKIAIGKGEKYEFTFVKEGIWGYHNHMRPLVVGKITVK